MADNILKTIQEKESEFSELYARMDRDRKAVHLDKFTLTGFGEYKDRELPRTVSVTMNNAAVFAHGTTSTLQGSKKQTLVEGLTDSQNKTVENFLDDVFYTADQRLQKRHIAGLWAWLCDHVVKRGPVGARWTFDNDGRPNCLPLDMRYCPFEDGDEHLSWIAPHHKRTVRMLQLEYGNNPEVLKLNPNIGAMIPGTGANIDVYDYWDDKVNAIYINGNKVLELPNVYGFVPAVVQFPPAGDYMMDDGYLKYWAESIFFLVRELIPEWNRLMSIQMTKAIEMVKPAYAQEVEDDTGPAPEYPAEVATVKQYRKGEIPKLMQTTDQTAAFRGAEISIADALHKGTANIMDLAETSGVRNAAWIAEQTAIRDKILTPRTQALEMFYSQLSILAIKEYQVRKFVEPKPLGKASNRHSYSPDQLGDPDNYTVSFRYMPDNTRQRLANYSVALAMGKVFSEDTILRDIVQCDDVEGEKAKKRFEEYRTSDEVVFYYDASLQMIKHAKSLTGPEKTETLRKAKLAADRMVEAIKKRKMSSIDQPAPAPVKQAQGQGSGAQALMALPSLMGGGETGTGTQAQGGNNEQL